MYLLQCLCFMQASLQFHLLASHISGVINTLADLFHNKVPLFLSNVTPANPARTHRCPHELIQVLLDLHGNWTSPIWTQQFGSFVQKSQQVQPIIRTDLVLTVPVSSVLNIMLLSLSLCWAILLLPLVSRVIKLKFVWLQQGMPKLCKFTQLHMNPHPCCDLDCSRLG